MSYPRPEERAADTRLARVREVFEDWAARGRAEGMEASVPWKAEKGSLVTVGRGEV